MKLRTPPNHATFRETFAKRHCNGVSNALNNAIGETLFETFHTGVIFSHDTNFVT